MIQRAAQKERSQAVRGSGKVWFTFGAETRRLWLRSGILTRALRWLRNKMIVCDWFWFDAECWTFFIHIIFFWWYIRKVSDCREIGIYWHRDWGCRIIIRDKQKKKETYLSKSWESTMTLRLSNTDTQQCWCSFFTLISSLFLRVFIHPVSLLSANLINIPAHQLNVFHATLLHLLWFLTNFHRVSRRLNW